MKFKPVYRCPACGEPHECDFLIDNDYAVDLYAIYRTHEWTCSGCGDSVPLKSCIDQKEFGEAYIVRMSRAWRKQEKKPKGGTNKSA